MYSSIFEFPLCTQVVDDVLKSTVDTHPREVNFIKRAI